MDNKEKQFPIIKIEELRSKYLNHDFWYLEDKKREDDAIIGTPTPGVQGELLYLFTDNADAEHYRHLVSKATAYQDDKEQAAVKSTKWREMDQHIAKNYGQWIAVDHEGAQILFELMRSQVPLSEAEEKLLHELTDDED